MRDLADLRKTYALAGLSEADAGTDPLALFERWIGEALEAGVPEPNAMTLATANALGEVTGRVVLVAG